LGFVESDVEYSSLSRLFEFPFEKTDV
jgi:hypothetical protein